MQLSKSNSNNLEKILENILDNHTNKAKRIDYNNNFLGISASVLSSILYVTEIKDIEKCLKLIKPSTSKFVFEKEILEKLCKEINCEINNKTFLKEINLPNLKVKIFAEPDAFFIGYPFPIEVKSILFENKDKLESLKELGVYQSKIYGYVIGTDLSYLVLVIYKFCRHIKILNYEIVPVSVNLEEIDKKIKKIVEETILTYFKNRSPRAGFEPAPPSRGKD